MRWQRALIGTGVSAALLAAGLVATGWTPGQATESDQPSAEARPGPAPLSTEPSIEASADRPAVEEAAVPVPAPPGPAPARAAPVSPPPTVTSPGPSFRGSVAPIDEATAARMTSSWRPGCPVPLSDLRLISLNHWGFDGQVRPGELVVHRAHADRILTVFAVLFEARFPIEQVRLVDEFGADDDRSMAANNTSGFNCRKVAGTRRWSQHAYGRAVDINPVQNPYVLRSGEVRPPAGRAYTRREPGVPGLITADGPVVAAFARVGWPWGGRWRSPDYQHFSANGR